MFVRNMLVYCPPFSSCLCLDSLLVTEAEDWTMIQITEDTHRGRSKTVNHCSEHRPFDTTQERSIEDASLCRSTLVMLYTKYIQVSI